MTATPELKAKHRTLIRQWLTLVRSADRRLDEKAHLVMSRGWFNLHREQP